MELQSIIETPSRIDFGYLSEYDLEGDRKGTLVCCLCILKLFEPFKHQFEKHLVFDLTKKDHLDVYLKGKAVEKIGKYVPLYYGDKRLAVLLGSLLVSAKKDCLTKDFKYYDFLDLVAETDKLIYLDFLGRESKKDIYSSDVKRVFDKSPFFRSLFEIKICEIKKEASTRIRLRYPPREIRIGNLVIYPSMYSLKREI